MSEQFSPEPWDGILDATKHSSVPMQDKQMMTDQTQFMPGFDADEVITSDENCLYLSVYTSNPCNSANLPVSTTKCCKKRCIICDN